MVNWEEQLEEVGFIPPWHLVSERSLSHQQCANGMDAAVVAGGRRGVTSPLSAAMHGLVDDMT